MKIKTVAFVIGVFLVFVSCVSSVPQIYNPENILEEDLIILHVDHALDIERIDNTDVRWAYARDYVVKLPSGVHTLYTKYNSGGAYAYTASPIRAQFEEGNTYLFTYSRSALRVSYHIYLYNDGKKGKEVTLRVPLDFFVK